MFFEAFDLVLNAFSLFIGGLMNFLFTKTKRIAKYSQRKVRNNFIPSDRAKCAIYTEQTTHK